ncbi:MAG: hypothetical protein ACREEM_32480 [Blastocatellia bacterium]
MKQTTDNEERMVNYLLGELPEEEQLRLEERFFTDDETYQQLLALEDELLYDYAAGGLSSEQRVKFERRFLNSPQARRKAELAGAVLDKAAEAKAWSAPPRTVVAEKKKSLWQSLAAFFSFQQSATQFSMAAAAAVLLLAGASWLYFQTVRLRSQVEQLEVARADREQQRRQQAAEERARQEQLTEQLESERRKRAQLEQELAQRQAQATRDRDNQQSLSTFLSFIIPPGLVRDVDGPKRLLIPPGVNSLRLQLDLKKPDDYRGYRATLRRETPDGPELWSQDLPRARSIASGRAIVVSLPAKLLPEGVYVLVLSGRTGGGDAEEIDDYYFNVVRQ